MAFIEKPWSFHVAGSRLAGKVLLPKGVKNPPAVVMAHGFGAEAAFGLRPFAERFASRGMAVFIFDYRGFGESEGRVRHYVHPFRHVEDWQGAVENARAYNGVDGSRLGIWGTSFSGGHVIVTAARVPGIRAMVAQVPFVDGFTVLSGMRPRIMAALTVAAVQDIVAMLRSREPRWVPLVGDPGTLAALDKPGTMEAFMQIVPEDLRAKWPNKTPARGLLLVPLYRPVRLAAQVACPSLVIAADNDNLIPVSAVVKTASKIPNAQLVRLPVGHFDPYLGEIFEKTVALEADFFEKHLGPLARPR